MALLSQVKVWYSQAKATCLIRMPMTLSNNSTKFRIKTRLIQADNKLLHLRKQRKSLFGWKASIQVLLLLMIWWNIKSQNICIEERTCLKCLHNFLPLVFRWEVKLNRKWHKKVIYIAGRKVFKISWRLSVHRQLLNYLWKK